MMTAQDESVPLLYADRARAQAYRTPFPWFQFSILFALQTATYMPYFVARPFVPDVWSSLLFEISSPKTLLVDSKYWGSERREGRGSLCWIAGARHTPFISGVSE